MGELYGMWIVSQATVKKKKKVLILATANLGAVILFPGWESPLNTASWTRRDGRLKVLRSY